MKNIFLLLILVSQTLTAQRLSKTDKAVIENLKTEVTYLASDQMEGRRTGTEGEKLAYEYLSKQFEKAGLIPKGNDHSFIQTFQIDEGKQVLPSTHLIINDTALSEKDFFPFIFSSNSSVKADASPAFKEKNMPWFWDVKETIEENNNNPHFDLKEAIRSKAIEFARKGASALIVYNSGKEIADFNFDGKSKTPGLKIPVVFLYKNAEKRFLTDNSANLNIDLKVELADKSQTGHNVIGFIDNSAPYTIVLGAHYDHLGHGEDEGLSGGSKGEIFNGADDNASGTVAVLELAKFLKSSKLKNNNYLFICFSGEEEGLYGSKYFAENSVVPLDQINYMMNFDMIGRLNDTSHLLTIGGFGTSPTWEKILPEKTKWLNIKFDSSGVGPSDHTSFYMKNIPVLFFFTGVHKDYHKPTDDADKINFAGEFRVIEYVENVLKETNKKEKLSFSKTKEPQMSMAHFTVTLGFMPDYTFSGSGVRVDEIIDGKNAQKIGMMAGDVITKLGDFNVTDINNYMETLSKFKKGDSARVTVMRGNDKKSFDVIF
ncbi:MAG TPA: M28 family peptidase [Hanamia sp.]|nr:M28 family peptidase [Hanamia sp.]